MSRPIDCFTNVSNYRKIILVSRPGLSFIQPDMPGNTNFLFQPPLVGLVFLTEGKPDGFSLWRHISETFLQRPLEVSSFC